MVRHKTRWLLTRIDFFNEPTGSLSESARGRLSRAIDSSGSAASFPNKRDLVRLIRENLEQTMGLAASAAAAGFDINGKFKWTCSLFPTFLDNSSLTLLVFTL